MNTTPPDRPDEPSAALTRDETMDGLGYIATSPAPGYGGFHPNTVRIARSAAELVLALEAELAASRNECERLKAIQNTAINEAEPIIQPCGLQHAIRHYRRNFEELGKLYAALEARLQPSQGLREAVEKTYRKYVPMFPSHQTQEDYITKWTEVILTAIAPVVAAEKAELHEQKCNLQNQVDNFDVNWEQQKLIIDQLRAQLSALRAALSCTAEDNTETKARAVWHENENSKTLLKNGAEILRLASIDLTALQAENLALKTLVAKKDEALQESGMSIISAKRNLRFDDGTLKIVMSDRSEVTPAIMCDITVELVNMALALTPAGISDELATAQARVKDLEQDGARLDWLESGGDVTCLMEGYRATRVIRSENMISFTTGNLLSPTARAAIDAARAPTLPLPPGEIPEPSNEAKPAESNP